ncbi:MAG TPA: maltotransferase domain-containing protein [Acetobacteraceae bacterium]|nr:maltotransferase domain-containing protein [Acetobacteraceae bacterium]
MEAREIGTAPRIYALDIGLAGGLDGIGPWLEHAAALGFDHVLLPSPFARAPGAGDGDAALLRDDTVLDPSFGEGEAAGRLASVAAEARRHGLGVLLDVVLDRIAADGPLAAAAEAVFAPPDRGALPDPRRPVERDDAALARLGGAELAGRAGIWWGGRIAAWRGLGLAGARLLGLARVPGPSLAPLLGALRRACPGATLIGWTPGIDWQAAEGLAGGTLDGVVPSLPWWNWRDEWLWRELELLRPAGRLIGCPEAPGGRRRLAAEAGDPAARERLLRRAFAFAAAIAPGLLLPMGFEFGLTGAEKPAAAAPDDVRAAAAFDLGETIAETNAATRDCAPLRGDAPGRPLSGPGAPVLAVLRAEAADPRRGERAALLLVNADLQHRHAVALPEVLTAVGGALAGFAPLLPDAGEALSPVGELVLAPGETRLYAAAAPAPDVAEPAPLDRAGACAAAAAPRIGVEDITPRVDGGAFAAKRVLGDAVAVEADVITDGHDMLGVALLWRGPEEEAWQRTRMRPLGNDRWRARFPLNRLGRHEFTIEAWRDRFASFRDELAKKHAAGVPTELEVAEGCALVEAAASRHAPVADLRDRLAAAPLDVQRAVLLDEATAALMAEADDRPFAVRHAPALAVEADRAAARFASWYEAFPRSMSDDPARHGTFDDVIRHLPRIRDMGFDVLYFPPLSPIGRINRKGRNNALKAAPGDPGSPYAIGAAEGGHDAIHPELGSLDDFRRLIAAAQRADLEIAIDFAIQCAPDHPWLTEHKGWFNWRPDGSLRYAENPPKKYEDIVNVDFYTQDAVPDLWLALAEVVLFWAAQGVRIFRVDNPHTKPLPFWEWLIREVRARHPDAIFLAEAFTRPKLMYRLAKLGFTQSYTYFTWRNTKRELTEYFTELSTEAPREFFRPNLFVNTPDINPFFLQQSGRPGFLIRAALAATLSGLWGVYNGFELCEAAALPGREEYSDSEKYQLRAWDWQRPGNIRAEITQLNRIRRANPALQSHLGVSFMAADNAAILFYERTTEDRSNVVLVAVNLDPHAAQEAEIELPLWKWQLPDTASVEAEDLTTDARFVWTGKQQRIRLPAERPYAIWRVRPPG